MKKKNHKPTQKTLDNLYDYDNSSCISKFTNSSVQTIKETLRKKLLQSVIRTLFICLRRVYCIKINS